MRRLLAIYLMFSVASGCDAPAPPPDSMPTMKDEFYTPTRDLGALYVDVQGSRVFADSKTFTDARPLVPADTIVSRYEQIREDPSFDLAVFVGEHFDLPEAPAVPAELSERVPLEDHLARLWPVLRREAPETSTVSTLIPLPNPYIVPGGRYREVYYWDSFFTMLGLVESGRMDLVEGMIENFAYQVRSFGYIPNGNRTYFLSRSQPPYFSQMLMLLASQTDTAAVANRFANLLQQEHSFWMDGAEPVQQGAAASGHVVGLDGGVMLNRYWDREDTPRPEFYQDDVDLAQSVPESERADLWHQLRSESESGWGLSSRWQREPGDATSSDITDIIPVDLNSLLYAHERALAELYHAVGRADDADQFAAMAAERARAIRQYHWDDERGAFYDYNAALGRRSGVLTLATVYPLYFGIATGEQARRTAGVIRDSLLAPGGFVTSTLSTGSPWDSPAGWAPLQWLTVRGLERYGYDNLAATGKERWLALNQRVYQNTGKMLERYDVVDMSLEDGGGDYPGQDGFGWTNGVALAFLGSLGERPVAPR